MGADCIHGKRVIVEVKLSDVPENTVVIAVESPILVAKKADVDCLLDRLHSFQNSASIHLSKMDTKMKQQVNDITK